MKKEKLTQTLIGNEYSLKPCNTNGVFKLYKNDQFIGHVTVYDMYQFYNR